MKYLILIIIFILTSISFAKQRGHHRDNDYIDARGEGDKKIIIIKHQDTTSNNGEVKIYKETLQECIGAIPDLNAVQAVISSEPVFAKGINGTTEKNWIKKYTASITINYTMVKTSLYLVTQKSIDPKKPDFKEFNKREVKSMTFVSESSNGDSFAGRSHRFYYFSSAEKATTDVKKQATVWLSTQEAVMCSTLNVAEK